MDTIFALASGRPPSAIAVMRISGPEALPVAERLTGRTPDERRAALVSVRDPADARLLDRALLLFFRGPRSSTGEDVVELHLHGGRAVVAAVETMLRRQSGLRLAEPGEFTRRAVTNGVIDLAQAEGLGDLLFAETEAQRRAALSNAEGALSRRVHEWTSRLLELSASVEAMIDFSDEDDVAGSSASTSQLQRAIGRLADEMFAVLQSPSVERLRDGLRVVLAGPPNSGKSTLLNALVERDAAIVSEIAGTTRDRIEAPVVRDGIPYLFTDTAGLAEKTSDPIEAIGILHARKAMAAADVILWLGDGPAPDGAVALHARSDAPNRDVTPPDRLALSAHSGQGVAELWNLLADVSRRALYAADIVLNNRQRELCQIAFGALTAAMSHCDALLLAEELRVARRALDRITGHGTTEDMLDALFGRFCIGK